MKFVRVVHKDISPLKVEDLKELVYNTKLQDNTEFITGTGDRLSININNYTTSILLKEGIITDSDNVKLTDEFIDIIVLYNAIY